MTIYIVWPLKKSGYGHINSSDISVRICVHVHNSRNIKSVSIVLMSIFQGHHRPWLLRVRSAVNFRENFTKDK